MLGAGQGRRPTEVAFELISGRMYEGKASALENSLCKGPEVGVASVY